MTLGTLNAGLVTVALTAHSLAVLAQGGDWFLDAAGVGVALLAFPSSVRPALHGRPHSRPDATSIVRGRTKTEVKDKLRTRHTELAAGVRTPAHYTVEQCLKDWL